MNQQLHVHCGLYGQRYTLVEPLPTHRRCGPRRALPLPIPGVFLCSHPGRASGHAQRASGGQRWGSLLVVRCWWCASYGQRGPLLFDAGLLLASIRDPNPTVFFEAKMLYRTGTCTHRSPRCLSELLA